MGVVQKLKAIFKKKEKASKESEILKEWKELQQKLEKHPLTQAKIINEELYQRTAEEIEKISKRVDDIDVRLRKVEEEGPKKTKPALKLSKKEKDVLNVLKDLKETDANTVSDKLNISRSNASLKLNRLYEEGFLDKVREGKNVFYKFKHD